MQFPWPRKDCPSLRKILWKLWPLGRWAFTCDPHKALFKVHDSAQHDGYEYDRMFKVNNGKSVGFLSCCLFDHVSSNKKMCLLCCLRVPFQVALHPGFACHTSRRGAFYFCILLCFEFLFSCILCSVLHSETRFHILALRVYRETNNTSRV